eukprot:719252-Hanusia_phi.AAC.1
MVVTGHEARSTPLPPMLVQLVILFFDHHPPLPLSLPLLFFLALSLLPLSRLCCLLVSSPIRLGPSLAAGETPADDADH